MTPFFNACGVKDAANDVIANTGQVSDAPTTHEDGRVFLQVVSFAGDIDGDFFPVG